MRQVMAQDVVPDHMPCISQSGLQPVQRGCDAALLATNCLSLRAVDRGQIEHARRPGVDLDVNGHTGREERVGLLDEF